MFVDASAIIAILAFEQDWRELQAKLDDADAVFVSPMCFWEACLGIARANRIPLDEAEDLVDGFLRAFDAVTLPVTAEIGRFAMDAARRFGRGRHPAGLNFGDCFAYAAARHRGVPLLFKGGDFARTDIAIA